MNPLDFEDRIEPIRKAYADVVNALEVLPASRMKALALTDLEASFSRALFAVSEIHSPIKGP